MNNIIQLKGPLNEKKNLGQPGPASIPKGDYVDLTKFDTIIKNYEELIEKWEKDDYIDGALVSVYYKRVVPKSKRVKTILSKKSEHSNDSIVGAKYSSDEKHIITHLIDDATLLINIEKIKKARNIVEKLYDGVIRSDDLNELGKNQKDIEKMGLSKSTFGDVISDLNIIIKIGVLDNTDMIDKDSIINYYKTNDNIDTIMDRLGISKDDYSKIESAEYAIRFKSEGAFEVFKSKVPYLVAMSTYDLSDYYYDNSTGFIVDNQLSIPTPKNEPIIGVIDTLFDKSVYFGDWVEYEDMLNKDIPRDEEDYVHGTSVTSIIVDGPSFNKDFDDGCGRFRVKHFGVAKHGKNNTITLMRNIRQIVKANPSIHVWNLSLGSEYEINENFISYEASVLDDIQYENNNVIFVIAGTNKNTDSEKRIGAPADSINSLVVNATDFDGNVASYSRKGGVLKFFNKPDICYYGGENGNGFVTCTKNGEKPGVGTSYAAPWISRKLAYLIDVIGLNREVAKALIIDSATGWDEFNASKANYIGFGMVPKRIEDILNSRDDEIKFFLSGTSNLYDTYTHNIPVPLHHDKYPFIAKATLCYFPKCTRNQGVDYTNTELDFYFGRIDDKGSIKSINENRQSEGEEIGIKEMDARKWYRKWDNVKHISQIFKPNLKPKQKYSNPLWGLSIKAKERLDPREEPLKFGVVITLKEINGVNRIDDFINQCSLRGWLVNRIDVENRIEVYNTAQEEIHFD